jgi:hypothetical protein
MSRFIKIESALVALTLLASGCVLIPKEYRGEFVDAATGSSLLLKGKKGTLRTADGRDLALKVDAADFERVSSGEPGILVDSNPLQGNLLEAFWVNPDLSTLQQAGGLVWYNAEVLYSQFDQNLTQKVKTFDMFHCVHGAVTVDTLTRRWQIGCPAGPTRYHFTRID